MREESDRRLMEMIRDEGDRRALQEVMVRYRRPLVRYASGIVAGRDEAQDVVQETFIRVWTRRGRWKSTGTVSAYLYRITRNLAINAKEARQAQMRWREEAERESHATVSRPDEELVARALRKEVDDAIAALPPRRREVFVLSRFHGLSYSEIGEAMEISAQTVANQMSAALSELREALCDRLDSP